MPLEKSGDAPAAGDLVKRPAKGKLATAAEREFVDTERTQNLRLFPGAQRTIDAILLGHPLLKAQLQSVIVRIAVVDLSLDIVEDGVRVPAIIARAPECADGRLIDIGLKVQVPAAGVDIARVQ